MQHARDLNPVRNQMGNGLGIFGSEEDAKEGLRRIYRLLANGGSLLVEAGNPFGAGYAT